MRENCLYWVWLTTLRGLSFVKIQALLDYFKTIENVYNAKEEDYLQVSAIRKNDISRLLDKNTQKAEQIIKRMENIGGYILTIDDEEYPQRLKDLENPPCVLYVRGKLFDFLQCATIGVVGTRECSDYGAVVTKRMSYELARGGAVIVSGMARGIDTYAAYSALRAGARTVAVLGCGVDVIYPPENVDIMNAIIKNGAVVSEYPPMSPPLGIHFPQRNRIIAGLCDGLLVTEAPYGSGALITAKCAYNINRKIYSVPGSVFSKESAGTNALIKKGAIAATHPNDILSDFPKDILDNEKNNLNISIFFEMFNNKAMVSKKTNKKLAKKNEETQAKNITLDFNDPKFASLTDVEKEILSNLQKENLSADEIIRIVRKDASIVNQMLVMLEINGFIKKLKGNAYSLNL